MSVISCQWGEWWEESFVQSSFSLSILQSTVAATVGMQMAWTPLFSCSMSSPHNVPRSPKGCTQEEGRNWKLHSVAHPSSRE